MSSIPNWRPRITAKFEVLGLTGAVLPGLSNTVGLKAKGIVPAFDYRSNNIRLAAGTLRRGQEYTVLAAGLPSIADLQAIDTAPPSRRAAVHRRRRRRRRPPCRSCSIRPRPCRHAGTSSTSSATTCSTTSWPPGQGVPVSIPPSRVDELLTNLEATPYEIVATQAMLARWIGVPSRIAFGFDGGEVVGTEHARGAPQERRHVRRGVLPRLQMGAGDRCAEDTPSRRCRVTRRRSRTTPTSCRATKSTCQVFLPTITRRSRCSVSNCCASC